MRRSTIGIAMCSMPSTKHQTGVQNRIYTKELQQQIRGKLTPQPLVHQDGPLNVFHLRSIRRAIGTRHIPIDRQYHTVEGITLTTITTNAKGSIDETTPNISHVRFWISIVLDDASKTPKGSKKDNNIYILVNSNPRV